MRLFRHYFLLFFLSFSALHAQEGFYYQAVIKNTDGSPLKETQIRIRIRIIEGETTLQFEEEKTITTSREGFVSFIIGESKPDEFATINWQGELYLQDEIDTGEGYGAPTKMPLLKTPRSYISDRAISVIDSSITSASILDQTILTEDLADSSITTEKLADSLITSNKIAKNAVVKETIATGSISTEAVIDSTLTNIDISPDAAIDVSKINIPDGSITLEKINLEDGIINYSKLNVEDGEIPFSKILIEDEEIPFEKLNITQENIKGLGIVSNYTGGSNLSITETTIDLDDEITLTKVTADLTGDLYNADSERVLEVGTTDNAAIYTGNVTGNLTGNLIGAGGKTVLANGNNITLAKYFGDTYYREDDGTETQLIDSKNKIFFGTFKGNLEGSWEGNVIGQGNEVVLDPITEDGSALFNGNVIGNLTGDVTGDVNGDLTGDVAATDITTTNLEATDITASGTITGNVEGNLVGDVTATDIVASGTIAGNLTGDILADDGTITLNNGDTNTNSTFAGNAATASTLSQTLSIEKGGTGAITAADARTALDVDQAGTDNSTNVSLTTVTDNYLTLSDQEITAGTVPVSLGGTGATTAADARTNLGLVHGFAVIESGTATVTILSNTDADFDNDPDFPDLLNTSTNSIAMVSIKDGFPLTDSGVTVPLKIECVANGIKVSTTNGGNLQNDITFNFIVIK